MNKWLVAIAFSVLLIGTVSFDDAFANIFDKTEYLIGETATLTFGSTIFDRDSNQVEILLATVTDAVNNESIVINLVETEVDTGIYTGIVTFSLGLSNENARILGVDDSDHVVTLIIRLPNDNIVGIEQISIIQGEPFAVKCLHTPILFQPGKDVTILAISINEAGSPVVAEKIEIWVDDELVSQRLGVNFLRHIHMFDPESIHTQFSYGCRVIQSDTDIFSGWKAVFFIPDDFRVDVYQYVGNQKNSIDLVFIPDVDSYDSVVDPDFFRDVNTAIMIFLNEPTFFLNQDKFNFWLARDTGSADGFTDATGCVLVPPSNWDTDYTWLDAGIVLHTDKLRDCFESLLRISSADFVSPRTLVHESGHVPFGLADEYEDGGHSVIKPFPNLYQTQADCDNDPFNSGKTCRKFISTAKDDKGEDWFTSDPAINDVMVDRGNFQPLDLRRVNWFLDQCDNGDC